MEREQTINAYFSPIYGFADHKPLAVRLLHQTITFLNTRQIPNCLIAGTLLGKVRHNDFIPWDDDMDMLVDVIALDAITADSSPAHTVRFVKQSDYIIKAYLSDGGVDIHKPYTWPFLDLFVYRWPNPQTINFFNRDWPAAEFFPFVRTRFLGGDVAIPRNPRYFLDRNYGADYMRTIKTTGWNHREEREEKKNATIKLVYDMPWHF